MSNFEKWANRTFGSEFINEETITYFRMSAAYDAGYDECKQQRDELLSIANEIPNWIGGEWADKIRAATLPYNPIRKAEA